LARFWTPSKSPVVDLQKERVGSDDVEEAVGRTPDKGATIDSGSIATFAGGHRRMDLEAPLKPEVLRPLITLVVPGTIALGPFVIIAAHYVPEIEKFWTAHPNAFTVLLSLAILTTGFVIDDFATNIEAHLWDPKLERKHKLHATNWKRYLQLQLKDELIAQRYLRTKLTQMKFELAMPPALVICASGIEWLNAILDLWSWKVTAGIDVSILAIAGYLLSESWQTANLLSTTRATILEAIDTGVIGVSQRPGHRSHSST
jgi:hypothetical protein